MSNNIAIVGDRVVRVVAGCEPDDFREDFRAAGHCEVIVLQHESPGAFTKREPLTVYCCRTD